MVLDYILHATCYQGNTLGNTWAGKSQDPNSMGTNWLWTTIHSYQEIFNCRTCSNVSRTSFTLVWSSLQATGFLCICGNRMDTKLVAWDDESIFFFFFLPFFRFFFSRNHTTKTWTNKIFPSKIYSSKTHTCHRQKHFACSKLRFIFPFKKRREQCIYLTDFDWITKTVLLLMSYTSSEWK